MKQSTHIFAFIILLVFTVSIHALENLDRGIVIIPTSEGTYIGWRFLESDPHDVSFNLYRNNIKVNVSPIIESTNYLDTEMDITDENTYLIRPIINGIEDSISISPGSSDTLQANAALESYITIPLSSGDYYVQHAWPADLNGDGEFDFIVTRHPNNEGTPVIEAYKMDGTWLWQVDMGPNASEQIYPNLNDPPPADISGWGNIAGFRDTDNITVYDLDGDGMAEVFVRTANGVLFADGQILESSTDEDQYISVIDGMTGTERTRTPVPDDYLKDGPLGGHFGIGYLDGENPSLITKFENRKGNNRGDFNLMIAAWDFDGDSLSRRWLWKRDTTSNAHNFHQIRIIDVNGDGKDDVCDGTYVIKHDGTFLYGITNTHHGDRFHVCDMDPDRPGLEGYGTQQDPEYYSWYYYDATNGTRMVNGENLGDVGRAAVGDIDPRHPGYEMWSIDGVYNKETKLSQRMPTVNFNIWWDEDLLGEVLDKTKIYKWTYETAIQRTIFGGVGIRNTWRNAPPFYGDVIGDWREEVLWETDDHSALRLYTTTKVTPHRIPSLAQNRGYRNCLTVKGYYQSNWTDYYLGDGMEDPNSAIDADHPYKIGELLFEDDFEGDLSNWHAEMQYPESGWIKIVDGQLEISTQKGTTTFFLPKLEGPVMIEYEATMVDTGGQNDRVSDINCFWMIKDLENPDSILVNSSSRGGIFRNYWKLPGYYVGKGGFDNTFCRFRKHDASGNGERILLGEYSDPYYLIKPGYPHKIQLIAADSLIQYICDNSIYFNYTDPEALTDGWFAFRQIDNRIRYDNFKVYRLIPKTTSVKQKKTGSTLPFHLENNYPNPFNMSTTIGYSLSRSEDVKISVFDIMGRQIRQLTNTFKNPGHHIVTWDGRDEKGIVMPSGIYLYQIKIQSQSKIGRMLLLK